MCAPPQQQDLQVRCCFLHCLHVLDAPAAMCGFLLSGVWLMATLVSPDYVLVHVLRMQNLLVQVPVAARGEWQAAGKPQSMGRRAVQQPAHGLGRPAQAGSPAGRLKAAPAAEQQREQQRR